MKAKTEWPSWHRARAHYALAIGCGSDAGVGQGAVLLGSVGLGRGLIGGDRNGASPPVPFSYYNRA